MMQRPGKTYRAAATDNGTADMKMRNFFREAAKLLNEKGEEDAAFYFEQMEEWINRGKKMPSTRNETAIALGI